MRGRLRRAEANQEMGITGIATEACGVIDDRSGNGYKVWDRRDARRRRRAEAVPVRQVGSVEYIFSYRARVRGRQRGNGN